MLLLGTSEILTQPQMRLRGVGLRCGERRGLQSSWRCNFAGYWSSSDTRAQPVLSPSFRGSALRHPPGPLWKLNEIPRSESFREPKASFYLMPQALRRRAQSAEDTFHLLCDRTLEGHFPFVSQNFSTWRDFLSTSFLDEPQPA